MTTTNSDDALTPEPVYRARRALIRAGLILPAGVMLGCSSPAESGTDSINPAGTAGEALTRFEDATHYNNFYEFGTGKGDPAQYAGSLRTTPWTVKIDGEAERTGSFDLAAVIADIPVEERVYRLRCVEGWSMVIPWQGVPLARVLRAFKPTEDAKFVAFTSLADPAQMRGVRTRALQWPYREGLRMDEAVHPLTLLATGMYGKPLPNQNGAPVRLVVPWKYGFKSIKSIVSITFTRQMPDTSWNLSQPDEYGFYSNVNPDVDHPRWSQRSERRIAGEGNRLFAPRIPTLPFNGYGDQVASLYAGMDLRRWF